MIVPQPRVLLLTGCLILPCAALFTAWPARSIAAGLVVAIALAVALFDFILVLAYRRNVLVILPPLSRWAKDKPGELEVRVQSEESFGMSVRLGLGVPLEFVTPFDVATVEVPPKGSAALVTWPCLPLKRGRFTIDAAYLEWTSPFGLWARRSAVAVASELRVYPGMHHDRQQLAALFLRRGATGAHAQRQVGQGREFEKIREYLPGDSHNEIHWKATAKRRKPVTKVYQIERTQDVYVVIDSSRLSARPAGHRPGLPVGQPTGGAMVSPGLVGRETTPAYVRGKRSGDLAEQYLAQADAYRHRFPTEPVEDINTMPLLERFMTAGLLLGQAAERQGDLFGLATFSNRPELFLRARGGSGHYQTCRDALYTLQPHHASPDYAELCTTLRLRIRRRALLIILTSIDDPVLSEQLLEVISMLTRQHVVVVGMIRPPGAHALFTAGEQTRNVDDIYRQLGGHLLWTGLRETGRHLQRRGAQFCLLDNEKFTAGLISEYMNIKRRQLL